MGKKKTNETTDAPKELTLEEKNMLAKELNDEIASLQEELSEIKPKKVNKLEREIIDLSIEIAENKTSSAYDLVKKTKELLRFREYKAEEDS